MINWLHFYNDDRGLKLKCGEEEVYVRIDKESGSMRMFTVKNLKATNDADFVERTEVYGQRAVGAMESEEDLCNLWTGKTGVFWDEKQRDWVYGEKSIIKDNNIRNQIANLEKDLSDAKP